MRRAIAFGIHGLSALLLALGISASSAQAAAFTWDGGGADDNWSTGGNWDTNTAPDNNGTADIVFAGGNRPTPNTDVGFAILSVTFDSTAQSFVNGGQLLTIGTGGVTNNSTITQTINNAIQLNGNQTFSSAAGDITFGGTISTAGATLTLDGGAGTTMTFGSTISGAGSLHVTSDGTVVLAANNTYTGGTTIDSGSTLQVGNGGATGSVGTGNIQDVGALVFDSSGSLTVAGNITGNGTMHLTGGGTVILTGTGNTFTGTTSIDSGNTLQIGDGGANGSVVAGNINDGGTLVFNSSGSLTAAGVISGAGSVVQSGSGTTTLNNANTYTGGTTVNNGTLAAGVTGAFQNNTDFTVNSGTLDLTNNGDLIMSSLSGTGGTVNIGATNLTVNEATSSTYGGVIAGSGNLDVGGTSTLTLTGTNTYSGTTTIEAGSILQVGNGGTTGALGPGAVTINGSGTTLGELIFNRSDTDTVANNISGGGMLTQNGSGTLILTGTNTYTGGTLVTVGTLQGSTSSIQGDITNLGTVTFDQMGGAAGTYAGVLSSTGAVNITDNSDVTFTGANTYSGTTTIDSGSILRVGNGGATGALGTGPVTDNGSLIFNTTADQTVSGAITGAGSLTQAGTNTLTLSGINAYTGGTTVSAGTLQGTTDSLQGAITNNSHVNFNQTTDGTYAGVMSGSGDVTLAGTGAVTFSAANTYTGNTAVNSGTLNLAGTGSVTSNTTTASGATLTGTGTVTGNVVNNGTFTPGAAGTSSGTFTVTGNYTNNSGSTVQIGVDSTPSNTVIDVSGTATLNGGTVMVDTSAGFQENHKYTFLTAGSFVGDYSSVTADTPNFILATLGRDASGEFVILQSNFISGAQTQNQRAVANYLDAIAGNASGDLQTVFTGLQGLSDAQAAAAFEAMSGDIHGTLGQLDIQSTTLSVQRIARHLRGGAFSPCGGPLVADDGSAQKPGQGSQIMLVGCNEDGSPEFADADCGCVHWTAWTQGYGLGGSAKSDGNAPGVAYDMGGTVAGLERWIDDCHLVGFYGGYNGTNVETDISHVSSINGGQFGGYFMLNDGFSYYTLLGGFAFDGFDTHRLMQFDDINRTADSDYTGWQSFWYIERGFTFQNGNRILQPFVALQYDYLRQNAFNETGADSIDLAGGGVTTNSLRSILGARLQYTTLTSSGRRFLPELHALWMHEYLDSNTIVNAHFTPMPVGSPGFTVQGLDFGRDWALLGTNVTWEMADGWSMFLNYDCQTNSQQTAHIGSGGLGCSW